MILTFKGNAGHINYISQATEKSTAYFPIYTKTPLLIQTRPFFSLHFCLATKPKNCCLFILLTSSFKFSFNPSNPNCVYTYARKLPASWQFKTKAYIQLIFLILCWQLRPRSEICGLLHFRGGGVTYVWWICMLQLVKCRSVPVPYLHLNPTLFLYKSRRDLYSKCNHINSRSYSRIGKRRSIQLKRNGMTLKWTECSLNIRK